MRQVVITRKISGGNRSNSGTAMLEKPANVVQKMNLRDLNLFTDGMRILRTSHG